MQSRLILEPHRIDCDTLEVAARLESSDGKSHRLWWRLPAHYQNAVATNADPFLVAFLFPMMQIGGDVIVEASASPSLLQNLDTLMAIWNNWVPQTYSLAQILPAQETEPPPPAIPGQAIIPFSAGVDSCFTAFRHQHRLVGRRSRNIKAAVVMHGFDIWLDQANATSMYDGLLAGARRMLDSLHIDCIPLSSNFHELPTNWSFSHGSHLAAALRLLSPQFDTALIPNSVRYPNVGRKPWGTNPFTDPFFSSRNHQVLDDGGDFHRYQKTPIVAQWPEAMQHLRVCFNNPGSHLNCCRCEKCALTMLSFRAMGLPHPPAFATDLTDREVARLRMDKNLFFDAWAKLSEVIGQRGLQHTSWARALRTAQRRNNFRDRFRRFQGPFIPLRNKIRKLFRGAPLSRKQLAKQNPRTEITNDK